MKEFLKQKFDIIIICVTIMVLGIAGFSFAYASNTNTIYTRDELSEKVDLLFDKNSLISVSTSNVNVSSIIEIPYKNVYIGNSNFFEFNNNRVTVKKSGIYYFTSYLTYSMSAANGIFNITSYKNNDVALTSDILRNVPLDSQASHISDFYELSAGDVLYIKYYSSVSSTIGYAKFNLLYLGE